MILGKSILLKRNADVHDTIRAMQRIVWENYDNSEIVALAKSLKRYSDEETFSAVWNWVRENIHYRNDEQGKEQLRRPQRTISDRTGDCDDYSILIASILLNLGYDCKLVVAAYRERNQWQHVYPTAYGHDGRRYVLDCVPEIPYFNY